MEAVGVRSEDQLVADGFAAHEIEEYRELCVKYQILLDEHTEAEKREDWTRVVEIEEELKLVEFDVKYRGKNPKDIPLNELKLLVKSSSRDRPGEHKLRELRSKIKNPGTAVKAFCVRCTNGIPKEIEGCAVMRCPLWPFRMGSNPFFGKRLPPPDFVAFLDEPEVEEETKNEEVNGD